MPEPAISDAKQLAYRLRKTAVLVIAIGDGKVGGASYGMTREQCRAAGKVLDAIMDRLTSGEISLKDVCRGEGG